MKKKRMLMALLLAALAVTSCGSDDDDDDSTPQREEDTTGPNGTTGSTGTGGTTGGSTASCMSSRQRENIRLFLNRASDLRTFQGSGTEIIREEDVVENNQITGTFDYTQSGENTWIVNAAQCVVGEPGNCEESQTVIAFRSGCLNVNGLKAKIHSASDSSLSYSILENGTVRERYSLATGKLRVDQTVRRDGETPYVFHFKED